MTQITKTYQRGKVKALDEIRARVNTWRIWFVRTQWSRQIDVDPLISRPFESGPGRDYNDRNMSNWVSNIANLLGYARGKPTDCFVIHFTGRKDFYG